MRKKSNTSSPPRPIIIKFTSLEKRSEILSLRNVFYTTKDNSKIPIYICPDRTIKEQEEHKKLVKQLKERREKGEENIKISNGKIVEYTLPFRANAQSVWAKLQQRQKRIEPINCEPNCDNDNKQ